MDSSGAEADGADSGEDGEGRYFSLPREEGETTHVRPSRMRGHGSDPGGRTRRQSSSLRDDCEAQYNSPLREEDSGLGGGSSGATTPIPWATLARTASLGGGFSMMTRSRSFGDHAPGVYKELPDLAPLPAAIEVAGVAPVKLSLFRRIQWRRDLLAIGIVYFVEGILDMMSLAVSYYLKDTLHLGPTAAGLVATVGQLPWQATPLLALITDGVPLFGYHRKGYLLMTGLVGSLCWVALAFSPSLWPAMVLLVLANTCTAWTQVIADAVTVKLSQGQDQQLAAFYQSWSWGTYMVGGVLSAYTSGVLLDASGPRFVFVMAAACLMLDAVVACFISEEPEKEEAGGAEGIVHVAEHSLQRGLRVLSQVWTTLRSPHIYIPALFIFLWQSSPSPSSAMFYFQTNVLGFNAQFQELVYIAGVLAALSGVLLYNAFLVNRPIRAMLLYSALVATALNATQLLLVSRLNLRLGLSDKLFVLGDYAMLSAIAEVMMTPMLAMAARVCPEGVEATLYATLYCIINLSSALSTTLGAGVTRLLGVTDTDFSNMTALVALCNVWMLLPLPLLLWVPDGLDPVLPLPKPDAETDPLLAVECSAVSAEEGRADGSALLPDGQLPPYTRPRAWSHPQQASHPTSIPVGAAAALEQRPSNPQPLPWPGVALPVVDEQAPTTWVGTSPSATVLLGRVGLPALLLRALGDAGDGSVGNIPLADSPLGRVSSGDSSSNGSGAGSQEWVRSSGEGGQQDGLYHRASRQDSGDSGAEGMDGIVAAERGSPSLLSSRRRST